MLPLLGTSLIFSWVLTKISHSDTAISWFFFLLIPAVFWNPDATKSSPPWEVAFFQRNPASFLYS